MAQDEFGRLKREEIREDLQAAFDAEVARRRVRPGPLYQEVPRSTESKKPSRFGEWLEETLLGAFRIVVTMVIMLLLGSFGSPILMIAYLLGFAPNLWNMAICTLVAIPMLIVFPIHALIELVRVVIGARPTYDNWGYAVVHWMERKHSCNPFAPEEAPRPAKPMNSPKTAETSEFACAKPEAVSSNVAGDQIPNPVVGGNTSPRFGWLRVVAFLVLAVLIATLAISGIVAMGKWREVMGDSIRVARDARFDVRHRLAAYYEEEKEFTGYSQDPFSQQDSSSRIILPPKEDLLETLEEKLGVEVTLFQVKRGFKWLPLPHFYCRTETRVEPVDARIERIEIGQPESFSWEEDKVDLRSAGNGSKVRTWKSQLESVYPVEFDVVIDFASLREAVEWDAAHVYVGPSSHSISVPDDGSNPRLLSGGGRYDSGLDPFDQRPAHVKFNLSSRPYEGRRPEYVHFKKESYDKQSYRVREYGYRLRLDPPVGRRADASAEVLIIEDEPQPVETVQEASAEVVELPETVPETELETVPEVVTQVLGGPTVVRADLPSDATLLADVDGVRMFTGDQLVLTAYAPRDEVWVHVWRRESGDDSLERGVETIVQGTGMLFGSDVSRRVFTRPDGAPAGYTYRTLMGEEQWVGAVGLKGALYRVMLSGDGSEGSEAAMRRVGEKVLDTLRLEPIAAAATAKPEPFRGRTYTATTGGWCFDYPTDMHPIEAPSPAIVAAFEGSPRTSFATLFIFDQTEALGNMGLSPAGLLGDSESGVYVLQQAAWGDAEQTRQAAGGSLTIHPGQIVKTDKTLQYAVGVDIPAMRQYQRFYFVISDNRFLVFCFAGGNTPVDAKLAEQVMATLKP
jgi:hypothetical protein